MVMVDMENTTGSYEWEYYYDYIDPVVVNESELKYNKCKYLLQYYYIFILRSSNTSNSA